MGSGPEFRFREAGGGDPVVLLDGWPWRFPALEEALAQTYRVFELEIPEVSTGPSATDGAADIAAQIHRTVASQVGGPYTLIGTSVGATVALRLALLDTAGVQALVLVSPLTLMPTPESLAGNSVPFARPGQVEFPPPDPDREESALALIGSASHDDDLEARLGEIICPTLAVFGQEDRLVAAEAPRIYREKIPNCNISFVYDAGHVIAAERPEALTSLVADFIQRRETFIVEEASSVINP